MAAQQQPAQFLLVPGEDNAVVDYATAAGKKQFHSMIAALDEPYDLSEENLKIFLDDIHTRSVEAGWNQILQIPSPPLPNGQPGPVHDLLTQYGIISMDRIRAHAMTYVNAQNRNAQSSMQMTLFIKKSLTNSAKKRISNMTAQFTVDGRESGTMLLKACILEARTDTQYSTKSLHDRLRNFKTVMEQQGFDVKKANEIVSDTINSIEARGETPSHDLIAYLFEGYKTAPDSEFVDYIKQKERDHDAEDADTPEDQRLTYTKLMKGAFNMYIKRVDKGVWKALTEEQEQIIALTAQVQTLQKEKAVAKKAKTKKKKEEEKKEANDDGEDKKPKKKTEKKEKPAWMLKPPTDGKNKKTVNGKEYHWCPKHKAWGRHLPADCRLPAEEKPSETPKLQLAKALGTLLEESE
jgi:hypothetical protein